MRFQLRNPAESRWDFKLLSENGRELMSSPEFSNRDAAVEGIRVVIAAMREGGQYAQYNERGQYFFRLTDGNKQVVAFSEAFTNQAAAEKAAADIEAEADKTEDFRVDFTQAVAGGIQLGQGIPEPPSKEEMAQYYFVTRQANSGTAGPELYEMDGMYWYYFNNSNGKAIAYSRGFDIASKRKTNIRAMLRYGSKEKYYERINENGQYYFIIRTPNGFEIARSAFFPNENSMESAIAYILTNADTYKEDYKKATRKKKLDDQQYIFDYPSPTGNVGFETFKNPDNKRNYFHLNDASGQAIFYSQAYKGLKPRDNGMHSVIRNGINADRYRIKERDEMFYLVLLAANNAEIARSKPYATAAEVEKIQAYILSVMPGYVTKYGVELKKKKKKKTETETFNIHVDIPEDNSEELALAAAAETARIEAEREAGRLAAKKAMEEAAARAEAERLAAEKAEAERKAAEERAAKEKAAAVAAAAAAAALAAKKAAEEKAAAEAAARAEAERLAAEKAAAEAAARAEAERLAAEKAAAEAAARAEAERLAAEKAAAEAAARAEAERLAAEKAAAEAAARAEAERLAAEKTAAEKAAKEKAAAVAAAAAAATALAAKKAAEEKAATEAAARAKAERLATEKAEAERKVAAERAAKEKAAALAAKKAAEEKAAAEAAAHAKAERLAAEKAEAERKAAEERAVKKKAAAAAAAATAAAALAAKKAADAKAATERKAAAARAKEKADKKAAAVAAAKAERQKRVVTTAATTTGGVLAQTQDRGGYAETTKVEEGGGFPWWLLLLLGGLLLLGLLWWKGCLGCAKPAPPTPVVVEDVTPVVEEPVAADTIVTPTSYGPTGAELGFAEGSWLGKLADYLSAGNSTFPKKFDMTSVQFPYNSAKMNKGAYPDIDGLAKLLKAYPNVRLGMNGHIDRAENDAYNGPYGDGKITLSGVRARCLYKKLHERGISYDRLEFKGYGKTKNIPNATAQENRRLEIVFLSR